MKTSLKIILLFTCLLLSSNAYSQKLGGPRDELIKLKMQKFMEALQVDSTTAAKYFTAALDNRKAINLLNKKRSALMEEIEANLDAPDLDSKLDQMEELEASVASQRKAFLSELKTFLTAKQIAQAILLEKKFGKKLKEEINKRKRDNN